MPTEEFSIGPQDIPPGSVMAVDEIGVSEWSPGALDENAPATQVHITFTIPGLPIKFAIRVKTRERAEWLCATIMKHAEGVWPKRT